MAFYRKLTAVGATTLAAIALSMSLSTAQAQHYGGRDYRSSCRAQIERAESRLDRAIRRHGRRSSEARERRRELQHVRERCRSERRRHPD